MIGRPHDPTIGLRGLSRKGFSLDLLLPNRWGMSFSVDPRADGDGFRIEVAAAGRSKSYRIPTATQQDFSVFFRELSDDFGTRVPHVFAETVEHPAAPIRWRPLLTENVHPQILVGYGDPAVLRTETAGGWSRRPMTRQTPSRSCTRSTLNTGNRKGFVFPSGNEPEWAAKGRNTADFWAPEMAQVDDEYWTVLRRVRRTTRWRSVSPARLHRPVHGSTMARR